MIASMPLLLLILLLVAAIILLVSRCNDGRGLDAVLLRAGRLVTAYSTLEYLFLTHSYLLLLLDTDFPLLISYPVSMALTYNRPRRVPRSFNN